MRLSELVPITNCELNGVCVAVIDRVVHGFLADAKQSQAGLAVYAQFRGGSRDPEHTRDTVSSLYLRREALQGGDEVLVIQFHGVRGAAPGVGCAGWLR
jgi:hypothetical protein